TCPGSQGSRGCFSFLVSTVDMANEKPTAKAEAPLSIAQQYAQDILDLDWFPKAIDGKATFTKEELRSIITRAHYAGEDAVIHATIDDLNKIRWSRQ
ncbi:MAG TPA: hypothetical protein VF477_19280, partial [Mycobacterium sp.]